MLDREGYRPNVGIILCNAKNEVFWGKRIREHSWQFPQGGIKRGETPEEAMFRELNEEVGLCPDDVRIIGLTRRWLYYHLPRYMWRQAHHNKPVCIGQRQRWFLLRLISADDKIHFDHTESPEFAHWQWVDYWHPLTQVIDFKRHVYQSALEEFEQLVVACVA